MEMGMHHGKGNERKRVEAARLIHPDWPEDKIRDLVDRTWEAYLQELDRRATERDSEG